MMKREVSASCPLPQKRSSTPCNTLASPVYACRACLLRVLDVVCAVMRENSLSRPRVGYSWARDRVLLAYSFCCVLCIHVAIV
jgi:hypothetical protein